MCELDFIGKNIGCACAVEFFLHSLNHFDAVLIKSFIDNNAGNIFDG
ncbi:hypothetical protein electrica_01092 [Klebsiella electrica]|nr:hypothetical protein electrica_01092 [Klebsiella electrica]BBV75029.1 hypothetical protein STW0522RAO56_10830 [Raoultella planticola]